MTNYSDDAVEVAYGSGNVFADLGIELTAEERVKIQFALQISKAIVERALTQAEAAKLLQIDQAKVSALTRGRIAGFSIERLMRYLSALGWDVDIALRPSASEHGQVQVQTLDALGTAKAVA